MRLNKMVTQWQAKREHTVLLLITVYEVPVDCKIFRGMPVALPR